MTRRVGSSWRARSAMVVRYLVRASVLGVSLATDQRMMQALLRSRRIISLELLLGFGEDGGVVELKGPVVGDLGPDHEAEAVGGAGHALVVGVVGEADVVAAEFFGPAEEGVDVFASRRGRCGRGLRREWRCRGGRRVCR